MKKIFFIVAGVICVILGVIGIVLPLLPTTPFMLLASFCFTRSSEKFNHWLLTNPICGKYLTNYLQHKTIPFRSKVKTIVLLWATLLATIFLADVKFFVIIILICVGIGVSLHIGLLGRKSKQPND